MRSRLVFEEIILLPWYDPGLDWLHPQAKLTLRAMLHPETSPSSFVFPLARSTNRRREVISNPKN
jgi:hypothetical protein